MLQEIKPLEVKKGFKNTRKLNDTVDDHQHSHSILNKFTLEIRDKELR